MKITTKNVNCACLKDDDVICKEILFMMPKNAVVKWSKYVQICLMLNPNDKLSFLLWCMLSFIY